MTYSPQIAWQKYRDHELALVVPLLRGEGYELDEEQRHMGGERFLMQAVTTASGRKLILYGTRMKDGLRVVIKATSDTAGICELTHERLCREMLERLNFAYDTFHFPERIAEFQKGSMFVTVQRFIEQERTFLERQIEEQCAFALHAFKAQESAHAATSRHIRLIRRVFKGFDAAMYLRSFVSFTTFVKEHHHEQTAHKALDVAQQALSDGAATIEQYCGFLTHTDFVPHNFRINNDTIYLLDHSSLRFGNKHEGWARFLNFMTLYNPELEQALLTYVHDNRAPEEEQSLWLMRLYRLGEIIRYYTHKVGVSGGDLQRLNSARVAFWTEVLKATLEQRSVSDAIREKYKATRNSLRSEDEKKRQVGLH